MKELSLNILDITENSTKAGATLVEISIEEKDNILTLIIKDNGSGMTPETLSAVRNPFFTTRTTRKVGMGIPLLQFAAEQTGGSLDIESKHISLYPDSHGTTVTAVFYKDHIDFTPLGDVISTLTTLIQGHPEVDFLFKHSGEGLEVLLDTREIREVLEGVPLDTFEVLLWIKDNLAEQYNSI
ncbi:MAG: sensor histidine kinase [Clostridia bacterium]|nr:sensor histidine kinase [Clostridia bacterium]MBO5314835.1 sensor histidine kinase [Clostridia bacterium]